MNSHKCTWTDPTTGHRCLSPAYRRGGVALSLCAVHQGAAVAMSDGRIGLTDDVTVVHGARAIPNPLDDVDPFA